jgi:MoaA/NifB/PqqE/SkfB family radical SAM enzyme
MRRVFRVEARHGQAVVYDPCTGLTRLSPEPAPAGRQLLDDTAVRKWPEIHPSVLSREFPVSVCWSPLVRCNLSCPHCLDDTSVPEAGPGTRRRIASLIGSSGILGADISGGEPLLLRELPELAAHLAAAGLATSITTNGWHLPRGAAGLAGRVDAIRVSLDGPNPASHDRMRGPGSFDRALAGLAASQAAGIPVQVHSVLMASTATHQAQRMVDLAARAGANGVTFLQMLPFGAGQADAPSEMLTDVEATGLVGGLRVPEGLDVRLRTREAAEGFTVVRADGRVWRNEAGALAIQPTRPLRHPRDLALTAADGSA